MLLLLSGCGLFDSLLEVEAPSQVAADELDDPSHANLLLTSAVSDFGCALPFYVLAGGLIGNELVESQNNVLTRDYDRRSTTAGSPQYQSTTCALGNQSNIGVYPPVATVRWETDNILRQLEEWTDAEVPNRSSRIATAAAYAGYSYILLGEAFCSAAVDLGPELTRAQVFALAEERFGRAIAAAQAAGNTEMLNLALLGRARTRLNLAKKAEAAADAQLVPTGFNKTAVYSNVAPRRENRVYTWNLRGKWASVGPAYRGLTFGGVADPRVAVMNSGGKGNDGVTDLWTQSKYTSESTPIPFARAVEARLIVAEVQGGQTAVGIINALHSAAGLPPFNSTDPAQIQQQVVEERQRELFLEGQRLGDVIRYNLPLLPAAGAPYPKGGVYGNQICLPLPDVERNNNPSLVVAH